MSQGAPNSISRLRAADEFASPNGGHLQPTRRLRPQSAAYPICVTTCHLCTSVARTCTAMSSHGLLVGLISSWPLNNQDTAPSKPCRPTRRPCRQASVGRVVALPLLPLAIAVAFINMAARAKTHGDNKRGAEDDLRHAPCTPGAVGLGKPAAVVRQILLPAQGPFLFLTHGGDIINGRGSRATGWYKDEQGRLRSEDIEPLCQLLSLI